MEENTFNENKSNNNIKKIIMVVAIVFVVMAAGVFALAKFSKSEPKKENPTITPTPLSPTATPEQDVTPTPASKPTTTATPKPQVNNDGFNVAMIKQVNGVAGNSNYLISPYNMEIALNMLRDGANGNTKTELDNLIGNRTIKDVSSKDKIKVANGVFIKNIYKNNVKQDYYNIIKTKYNSEIIYDKFTTPDKINNWVNEKTNGMIKKILNNIDSEFVMGLASVLTIDVKWRTQFECQATTSQEFTKEDNTKYNVEMMHVTYEHAGYKYIKTNDVEGVIIPYQGDNNIQLEFIGLLPNDGVNNFVNGLTKDKLDTIYNSNREASSKLHISVALPRFTYDYSLGKFIDVLKALGVNDAFDYNLADFKKMVETTQNIYVQEAIHKTHIELSETGTKAAAVTYIGMANGASLPQDDLEKVSVVFDKPFVYMIREKNSGELLFFGAVYEPNKWTKSTCSDK